MVGSLREVISLGVHERGVAYVAGKIDESPSRRRIGYPARPVEVSAPADRIRPVLQAISTAFPHNDTRDALAALAELEADAEIGRDWRADSSLAKWFPSTALEREESREELRAIRVERDELRAKLAEYEQAPTIMTRGDGLELIARPTRRRVPLGVQAERSATTKKPAWWRAFRYQSTWRDRHTTMPAMWPSSVASV